MPACSPGAAQAAASSRKAETARGAQPPTAPATPGNCTDAWEAVDVKVVWSPLPVATPKIKLGYVNGKRYRVYKDDKGREAAFHGTNVVVKGPPYYPSRGSFNVLTSLVKEDFEAMVRTGFNLIRLGVSWEGAEPVEGSYDYNYYKVIKEIIEEAGTYGIYVLTDMHQDALAGKYCGWGVPNFAAAGDEKEFPKPYLLTTWNGTDGVQEVFPTNHNGDVSRSNCSWMGSGVVGLSWETSLLTFAGGAGWQGFWDNKNGARDKWTYFWGKTAAALKGIDNILGHELINEPWNGDIYSNPLVLVPQVAEAKNFLPSYDAALAAIRHSDPDVLVMFPESPGQPFGLPDGFYRPPGGWQEASKTVLSFHYYQIQQVNASVWAESHISDAERLGTSLLMTESCCDYYLDWLPEAAARGLSSLQWSWKAWCNETLVEANDGTGRTWYTEKGYGACINGIAGGAYPFPEQTDIINNWTNEILLQWVRDGNNVPYPTASQGAYLGSWWTASTRVFELHVSYDPSISAPTEVFLSEELWYPAACNGFKVEVLQEGTKHYPTADVKAAYYKKSNKVLVWLKGGVKRLVKIRMSPKSAC